MNKGRSFRSAAIVIAGAIAVSTSLGAAFAQEEPVSGGTFTMSTIASPLGYPFMQRSNLADVLFQKLVLEGLVVYSAEDLSPQPRLAESWDISEDGTLYTFHLRDGVTWHDGEAFDAEDVKFTLELVQHPSILSTDSTYYRDAVQEVRIVDPLTVEVELTGPTPELLTQLGYNFFILPEHVLSEYSMDELVLGTDFSVAPMGTGAFKFDELVPGEYARVVRNDDYWGQVAYLDAVVQRVIPDGNAQVAQLPSGVLDFAQITEPQVEALSNNNSVSVEFVPQVNYQYFALNLTNPLFQDVRVRQAMLYALDRETIIDVALLGTGTKALHAISPILSGFNADVLDYPYDPERAAELLDEAGWLVGPDGVRVKDGQRFSFELLVDRGNIARETISLIAEQNWRDIGLDPNYQFAEFATAVSRYRAGDYEARIAYWATPPMMDFTNYWHSEGQSNLTGYANPRLDELLELGRVTIDEEERTAIYNELQAILAEDVPAIWVAYPSEVIAMNSRVHGWPDIGHRDAIPYLNQVWKSE